ncbi:MAG: PQQ-dependent sugar dehydrogenase, partial [Anaerolineaceae bacterium]|nr:PQQ-dependent sugar dehydrogenase [Anaerolineaceae bacterium]
VPAPGNPFPGSSVWATGLWNTFGMDFDLETGYLFATENGPTCDDEINLIIPGQNYGWNGNISCDDPPGIRQAAGLPPLISWTPTISPTSLIIYHGDAFPEWQGDLFFCTFNNIKMYRVILNEQRTRFASDPMEVPVPNRDVSCSIEIAQSPEGYIYYSTVAGIYRLVPATPATDEGG